MLVWFIICFSTACAAKTRREVQGRLLHFLFRVKAGLDLEGVAL